MTPKGVRHRAVGGSSPRIGAVLPECLLGSTVADWRSRPLRPDDFGGGTETSVSLHREPRPSEISVLLCVQLAIEIFAKCRDDFARLETFQDSWRVRGR
jgi:hypothetical protein